jgi:dTDP-4-dehydrorhamnose reductase
MRVLIIGGDSTIGSALKQALASRRDSVCFTTRRPVTAGDNALQLDLASFDVGAAQLPKTDIAFFCAAITGFSACRKNIELARQINVTATTLLARRLVAAGSKVVLLSSSAVFDWRIPHVQASRPPCPTTVYGQLKAEAEKAFSALGPAASILRLSKVQTPGDSLFKGWISHLSQKKCVNAYSDHHFAPVTLADAVAALLTISNSSDGGLFQISGARDISYFDAASHLASRIGADPKLVVAANAGKNGIPPLEIIHNSTLDTARITALTGWKAPDPFSVIDEVFHDPIRAARAGCGERI